MLLITGVLMKSFLLWNSVITGDDVAIRFSKSVNEKSEDELLLMDSISSTTVSERKISLVSNANYKNPNGNILKLNLSSYDNKCFILLF